MGALTNELADGVVHLCLDMQRLFSPEGPWPTPWMERVLPKVVELVEFAPERTVFTRFIPPETAADAQGGWRRLYKKWPQATRTQLDAGLLHLIPPLADFAPPAKVFDKSSYSAFAGGRLHGALAGHGIHSLIVSGSETDVCVLATVLAAVDLGYRVVIAEDAVCSSSDTGHDALLTMYRKRLSVQIEIAPVDKIVSAWRR